MFIILSSEKSLNSEAFNIAIQIFFCCADAECITDVDRKFADAGTD